MNDSAKVVNRKMGGVNHCSLHRLSFGEIQWFDDQRRIQPCD